MRKILISLLAVIALIFGIQNLYAADNAFKNTLLKIDITKHDDTHYNIGLYTQKVYNEPVKVVQKTNNIYYFLLPETNSSITSTPSVGAVTNIVVKTYPYAGQDVKNGYTKVAIMTDKPVNFETSLKTLDPSVSPRLDPTRLARLDNVFARYAEKLAQNNIPSPLQQFIKPTVAHAPKQEVVQQAKQQESVKVASSNVKENDFEEYQNKLNREQAENKAKQAQQAQKVASATKQAANTKPAAKQTTQSKPANQPVKQVAQKPAAQPVQQKPASQPAKQVPITQKIAQAIPNKTVQQPVKQQTAQKPISQNSLKQPPKEQVKPNISVKEQKSEPEKLAQAVKAPVTSPVQNEAKPSVDVKQKTGKNVEEYEKQLKGAKPVDVQFKDETKAPENVKEEAVTKEEKPATETVNVPVPEQNKKDPLKTIFLAGFALVMLFAAYLFAGNQRRNKQKEKTALVDDSENIKELLKKTKPSSIQPDIHVEEQQEQQNVSEEQKYGYEITDANEEEKEPVYVIKSAPETVYQPDETDDISDNDESENIEAFNNYMDSAGPDAEEEIIQETQDDEMLKQLYTPIESPAYSEYNKPIKYEDMLVDDDEDEEIYNPQAMYDEQEVQMQEQAQEEEQEEYHIPLSQPQYESKYQPSYQTEYEPTYEPQHETETQYELQQAQYQEEQPSAVQEETQSVVDVSDVVEDNEDVATIVSSSKLTETRGLYLAKFEGSTSLVGYIQDDIYVLYNFGEGEIKETSIESNLAEETDTDSLYIVKTGGKKLMVKSTPYDMSLEMVM